MSEPVYENTDSKLLYVFFAGLAVNFPPQIEFYRVSSTMPHNRWFLLDNRNAWYQHGIPGLGSTIRTAAKALDMKLTWARMEKVCFVGISMGGFAALLFSALMSIPVDVIAVGPQTFISAGLRQQHNDTRWEPILSKVNEENNPDSILDLAPVLKGARNGGKVAVLVPSDCNVDMVHARHIEGLPRVHLYPHKWIGHDLFNLFTRLETWPGILAKMGDQ